MRAVRFSDQSTEQEESSPPQFMCSLSAELCGEDSVPEQ